MIEEGKKETHNLKRRVDRLYKKCVEEIEKLTKENLPQKTKAGTGKCQIIVPEGKLPGEELTIRYALMHILSRITTNAHSRR